MQLLDMVVVELDVFRGSGTEIHFKTQSLLLFWLAFEGTGLNPGLCALWASEVSLRRIPSPD